MKINKLILIFGVAISTITTAQNTENADPYSIFGKTYTLGEDKARIEEKVFIIENFPEGSPVYRIEHHTGSGIVKLFDKEDRQIGETQLSRTERAWMTPDPLAEKYYSISPYAYCLNNPMKYIDQNGDSVRVYTETNRTGHTWLSVGEEEDMIVYSYGRYNGTNKGADGSSNSLANGPGVLLKLVGDEAQKYNQEKAKNGMSIFVITDIPDDIIMQVMDEKFNSSIVMPETGKYKNNPSAHVIDEYNLTKNNCTTVVSDVLNSSGSKALKGIMSQQTSSFGTWTSIPVTNRFVLPAAMENYLIKSSRPGKPIYRTR